MKPRLKTNASSYLLEADWRSHLRQLTSHAGVLGAHDSTAPRTGASSDAGGRRGHDLRRGSRRTASSSTPQKGGAGDGGVTLDAVARLGASVGEELARVRSSEARINASANVRRLADEYRDAAVAAETHSAEVEGLQEVVNTKSTRLAEVQDSVAQVREQLEERGSSMTNSAPLQRIRTLVVALALAPCSRFVLVDLFLFVCWCVCSD